MKFLIASTIALLCSSSSMCQDVIIKMNGDELKAKVVEINDATVKYKKWENLEGPVYNIKVTEIVKIKYENGQSDMFNQVETHPVPVSHQENALTQSKNVKATAMPNGYPIPVQANVPYYYNANTNTLSELERVTYLTEKVRSGAWGRHNLRCLFIALAEYR